MQSVAIKLNDVLETLDEEDYDKAVSYIEFLVTNRKKTSAQNAEEINAIVASLIGSIPDTGNTLEEYREERRKKYALSN